MIRVHGAARLTHTPELRDAGNTKVCTFQVATNEFKKNADNTYTSVAHFFSCVLWDTGAERFVEKCKKGDLFFIEDGELKNERWTGEDGEERQKTVIRINKFLLPKSVESN